MTGARPCVRQACETIAPAAPGRAHRSRWRPSQAARAAAIAAVGMTLAVWTGPARSATARGTVLAMWSADGGAGAVTGIVRNGTSGRPAAGQAVTLVSIGSTEVQPTSDARTDAAGRFAFRGLPDGRYLVQARHQGVPYAVHAVVAGGPVHVTLTVYEVAPDVPLRVALLGVAVDVHAGYVRVSEVVHLYNATTRTFLGDVVVPLPPTARYVAYHAGFDRPRTERGEIRDRLVVRPGAHQLSFSYAVAGAGTVPLDRRVRLPVDRVVVFVTAPAEVRAPRFQPAPDVAMAGGRYTRAWARAVPPGDLALRVVGVPPLRRWPAPAAAAALAGVLLVGLTWALRRQT